MSVDQRREALIESAYRVIADHGVEGATTRRICAHAKMPLASFHYAFESRTALLAAVMDKAVPFDITLMLESILPKLGDSSGHVGRAAMEHNMRAQLNGFYALLQADPGRMQAAISLGIYAHNHLELQPVGRRMYERLYELASGGLEVAAGNAGVGWDTPVSELGPLVIAATNAITLIHLSADDEVVIGSIIDSVVAQMMSHVVE